MKNALIYKRSFPMLKERVDLYFQSQGKKSCYFDPFNQDCLAQVFLHTDKKPLNIVFVGGVLASIFSARDWPITNYQLWVLSLRAKNLLHELMGIPEKYIGVVPRYKLFPASTKLAPFHLSQPFTLVYAGSLTQIKGLFHMIEFTQYLQVELGLPVRLVLCGEFLEHKSLINYSQPPPRRGSTKAATSVLISSLPWKEKPSFYHGLAAHEWSHLDYENPVFISLSQLSHEDFGVSLAQAQALGWPCILSPWGGHADAVRKNTWFTPQLSLFASAPLRKKEVKKMAHDFVRFVSGGVRLEHKKAILNKCQPIHSDLLDACISATAKKYPGIEDFSTRGLHGFIKKKSGKRFFQQYNKILHGEDL